MIDFLESDVLPFDDKRARKICLQATNFMWAKMVYCIA